MKALVHVGLAAGLLLATTLLITAFLLIFSYAG